MAATGGDRVWQPGDIAADLEQAENSDNDEIGERSPEALEADRRHGDERPKVHSLSMDAESRDERKKPFACDVCGRRYTEAGNMRRHKQTVHGNDVFKCPQPGCQVSSARKVNLMHHVEGFHGTAGSFSCDHPGCTCQDSSPDDEMDVNEADFLPTAQELNPASVHALRSVRMLLQLRKRIQPQLTRKGGKRICPEKN